MADGTPGNDTLLGTSGADTLYGFDGHDTYYVNHLGDLAVESYNDAQGGVDRVFSTVSYVLGFGLEHLTLQGSAAINGTGNGNNNILTGNAAANVLNGAAGADSMYGGDGSDTYYVDSLGDLVVESYNDAQGGVDRVFSTVSHTLGFGLEHLTLQGSAAINGTGNGNNNILTGNAAANVLNGAARADSMYGGDGSDTYYVDSLGDLVVESYNDAQGGVDRVFSTVSHTLGFGLEHLTLQGSAAINGTGNGNNNILTGNAAANVLNGAAGADSMYGGDGSDTYYVDSLGDLVVESYNDAQGGVDRVFSTVSHTLGFGLEHLTLQGSAAINGTGNGNNNILTGNAAANVLNGAAGADSMYGGDGSDTLVGGAGNDTLTGGAGVDRLTGGAGNDRFVFLALSDSTGIPDRIIGFERYDRIDVSAIDANMTIAGNQAFIWDGGKGAGHLWAQNASNGSTLILGNVDSDAAAEFVVEIVDGARDRSFYASFDFVL